MKAGGAGCISATANINGPAIHKVGGFWVVVVVLLCIALREREGMHHHHHHHHHVPLTVVL